MIDLSKITLGCELELGDVDTSILLPRGNVWCNKDGSIMNSNGTANDPLHKLNRFGGEIQVKPARSEEELLDRVLLLYDLLGNKDLNFTTNLHIHIRIPNLVDDVDMLRKIISYILHYQDRMYNVIDPIPKPESDYGSIKRYKRRLRSHHGKIPQSVWGKVVNSQTSQELFENLVPHKNGKPLWALYLRPGVNIAHLWKQTETIEFRHFTMSVHPQILYDAFCWPRLFIQSILDNVSPLKTFRDHHLSFPSFFPYDPKKDKIFQLTNVYHNTRKVAKENYEKLISSGVLTRRELGI